MCVLESDITDVKTNCLFYVESEGILINIVFDLLLPGILKCCSTAWKGPERIPQEQHCQDLKTKSCSIKSSC